MKLNVIFPMAGEGSRFGYKFKPFIQLGDLTFIELAVAPFLKNIDKIDKFYFVITKEQEEIYNVTNTLQKILDVPLETIIIPEKTSGPYQTIKKAIEKQPDIRNNSIICDCDHAIDTDYIFKNFNKSNCILPVWEINDEEQNQWSKVVYSKGELSMVCEKEIITSPDIEIFGIIGCVFFSSLDSFLGDEDYVSDAIRKELKNDSEIQTYIPKTTAFFGDPVRLQNFIEENTSKITFFIDFDGTLVKHESIPDYDKKPELIVDVESLHKLRSNGHRIVITTARSVSKINSMKNILKSLNIPYDDIVMGCSSGPRVLVNDIKPKKPFLQTARAVNISRDSGWSANESFLNDINLVVHNKLGGFSPADKIVLEDNDRIFVRKSIKKTAENETHTNKLKMQAFNMKRFNFMWNESTPEIYNEYENDDWYFYDMEYLDSTDGWMLLEESNEKEKYLDIISQQLYRNVYCFNKPVEGISWLKNHIEDKIVPKFLSGDADVDYILSAENLTINGEKTISVKYFIDNLDHLKYVPKNICPIHGDLTFENILVDSENVKLIDLDGSDFYDAPELDMGKMYQSFLMKYSSWCDDDWNSSGKSYNLDKRLFDIDPKLNSFLNKMWSDILVEDNKIVEDKSIFFAVLHLIRLIPFKLNKNKEHAILSALLSRHWLNILYKKENT
jgi:hydroxymethylpyrimidine pyrophosphatase-like HAD family hydrolase